jgi:hypothetical protein
MCDGELHHVAAVKRPIQIGTRLLILLASVIAAAPTLAASRQMQEKTARKACLAGDVTKGVAILSDLFVETRDPAYIFNQGRCFEQNRRFEDAIGRFEEYLRVGENLDASNRELAEKHIADCQAHLPKAPVTPVPGAPMPGAPMPGAMAPAQVVAQPAPPIVVDPAPAAIRQVEPASPGSGLRTAGIITASVGGAALVTGVLLNLKVNAMARDMETPGRYSDSKESDRKSYVAWGWVSYGVGAACVATGAVLYGLGWKSGTSSLALLPSFAHGEAGAVVGGAF